MKINELLESRSKKEFRKSAKDAIPGLQSWKELDNNISPYMALRFGIMCAGSPDFEEKTHADGPAANNGFTINYSKGEDEILNAAAKKMGVKGKRISSNKSTERDDVHKISPVSNWNKASKSKKDQ